MMNNESPDGIDFTLNKEDLEKFINSTFYPIIYSIKEEGIVDVNLKKIINNKEENRKWRKDKDSPDK